MFSMKIQKLASARTFFYAGEGVRNMLVREDADCSFVLQRRWKRSSWLTRFRSKFSSLGSFAGGPRQLVGDRSTTTHSALVSTRLRSRRRLPGRRNRGTYTKLVTGYPEVVFFHPTPSSDSVRSPTDRFG